jgi:hypothetical protein
VGIDPLPGITNYLLGHDPKRWHTRVRRFRKVKQHIYPGVELTYYENERGLEWNFAVRPGASSNPIRLRFVGAQRIWIDARGALVIQSDGREILMPKPVIYQELPGRRQRIPGGYVLIGASVVGFTVAGYDRKRPLIIDPELTYSTYLGGSGTDQCHGIAVDASGNVYVTGQTTSADFPVTRGKAGISGPHAFVTKIDGKSGTIVYSTYLGGTGGEQAYGIAVDGSGNAYVTGQTISSDFPVTPGAIQRKKSGTWDAFVTKLDPQGSHALYSTFAGGSGDDYAQAIAVDASGNAYVAGSTESDDFPTTAHALQRTKGRTWDAFVIKVNSRGSALAYSTYLGASGEEYAYGIAVDRFGSAFVTGQTSSPDFRTTPGAFQPAKRGLWDIFVAKLDTRGAALNYSTFLGGSGTADYGYAIAVDRSGDALITGYTDATDFPTTAGAFQPGSTGGYHAFLSRLNAAGARLVYSTYLRGSGDDYGRAITIDASGQAWITGRTNSTVFPTTADSFQTRLAGTYNTFVTAFDPHGEALAYSTYFGGNGDDYGRTIAVDAGGNVWVAGSTTSTDFPAVDTRLSKPGGPSGHGFVARFQPATSRGEKR